MKDATLKFGYWMAWWRYNCVTSHVTNFYFIQLLPRINDYVEFWRKNFDH